MKLDWSTQQLLIIALRTLIDVWEAKSKSGTLSADDDADLQNDIGSAYILLGEMESNFSREFGHELK